MQDPDYRARTLASYAQIRKDVVQNILEQRHWGKFALFYVTRKEQAVTISWSFHASAGNPLNCHVMGLSREMSLIPSPSRYMDGVIVKTKGDGSVSLALQEGCSYYFEFFIDRDARPESSDIDSIIQSGIENSDTMRFQVAVPLSDEHKAILKQIGSRPEETIQQEMRQFVRLEDTYDEELQRGIEAIKGKKLPPAEEEDKISRLRERLEFLKERIEDRERQKGL